MAGVRTEDWPRVYRAGISPAPVAALLAIIGIALAAWILLAVRDEHPAVVALTLLVPAMFGVGAVVVHRFGATYTIVCSPDELRVETRSRWGRSRATHRWADVTETRCWQEKNIDAEGNVRSHTRFAIHVGDEQVLSAVSMRDLNAPGPVRVRNFSGFVATVNELTPHLGYVWAPNAGSRVFSKAEI